MMQAFLALFARVLLSGIFLYSGYAKVLAPRDTIHHLALRHMPFPTGVFVFVVLVEILGGVLLLLGARTRAVAFVLAVFTAVVAFYFHFDFTEGGRMLSLLKDAAIVGGLLHVAAFGGGRLSLDRQ